MLASLMAFFPHKVRFRNILEIGNELVVLILLLLSWMMLISIEAVKDTEAGLKIYDDFGFVFTILLLSCIVFNFVRIVCGMCG